MKKFLVILLSLGLLLGLGTAAVASTVDTIQAPTEYFVPTDAQKYDYNYWRYNGDPRWGGGNWGWEHNAIGGGITAAVLNISAFDVDFINTNIYLPDLIGERDQIFANDSGTWVNLGFLDGGNDIWQWTAFTLGANFFDDIANGLEVKIEIDTLNEGWAITLAKSSLEINGGVRPDPNPGAVPEPATMMLFGLGLLGLAGVTRKQK